MKRQILTIAAVLALVFAGAVFAQSANTTAPGPTIQQQPNLTNNNEPNPGTQVPDPNAAQPAEGTATQNLNNEQTPATGTGAEMTTGTQGTPTDTQVHPETEPTTGPVDVDVDTGNKAQGAVDVDVTTHPDADTDASGTGTETTATSDNAALPSTASDLPTVVLIGLLALGAAFVLRVRRNA
jgi:LPXTG-motif cell wall-anchored protein